MSFIYCVNEFVVHALPRMWERLVYVCRLCVSEFVVHALPRMWEWLVYVCRLCVNEFVVHDLPRMSRHVIYVFYIFTRVRGGVAPTPQSRALPLTIPVKGLRPLTIPFLIGGSSG
jgi:hypothetical protein